MGNILPFALGLFISTYAQNPKFAKSVNGMFQGLLSQGIDAINKTADNATSVTADPDNVDESAEQE
jgi:hypothetical protein